MTCCNTLSYLDRLFRILVVAELPSCIRLFLPDAWVVFVISCNIDFSSSFGCPNPGRPITASNVRCSQDSFQTGFLVTVLRILPALRFRFVSSLVKPPAM
jgi:hypothetical protein